MPLDQVAARNGVEGIQQRERGLFTSKPSDGTELTQAEGTLTLAPWVPSQGPIVVDKQLVNVLIL